MADDSSDAARLAFDREKWETERQLRERELALKEREQQLSSWTNPLTVAVAVAALAWVGNVIATWWNGRLQRVQEKERADQTLRLEESKAESERILEMIKTGDPGNAATNLKFLLDAGLLASAERVSKIREYLQKTPLSSGPALPAAGARFTIEQSEALSSTDAAALQRNLNAFVGYLDKVGFAHPDPVQVRVTKMRDPNAEYHPDEKAIVIDPALVGDPYPAHREYMHHLLFASKPGNEWRSWIATLENGVADYFSGSFSNNPLLGRPQSAKVLRILDRPYIRRLDNELPYRRYKPGDEPHDYGEMWGGVFWDIREKLGAELTDKMLALAWPSMLWPVDDAKVVASFVKSLLETAETIGSQRARSEVHAVLRARKVPLSAKQ
jgi:hypothetical protein